MRGVIFTAMLAGLPAAARADNLACQSEAGGGPLWLTASADGNAELQWGGFRYPMQGLDAAMTGQYQALLADGKTATFAHDRAEGRFAAVLTGPQGIITMDSGRCEVQR